MVTPENIKKVYKIVLANCKVKQYEIADTLKILNGTFFHEKAVFEMEAGFAHSGSKTTIW